MPDSVPAASSDTQIQEDKGKHLEDCKTNTPNRQGEETEEDKEVCAHDEVVRHADAALAAAVDGNPYSVLSSTLDHVTLTVQSEEAVEEKEDCAIVVSPEMQMKQEEVEQLKDCEAMNADWTVIQSQRQQREERQRKEGRH